MFIKKEKMEKAGRQRTCLQPASVIQGAKGSSNKTEQKLLLGSPCTWGLCPRSPAGREDTVESSKHFYSKCIFSYISTLIF